MGDRLTPEIRIASDSSDLARAVAERIALQANQTVAERGRFALVLSGGRTPLELYRLLSGPFLPRIPWPQVHLFWGDERCVPPDHPDSNFGMANEALVSKVPLPRFHLHRMLGEIVPPRSAALAYEEELRGVYESVARPESEEPLFDLVLLGVGSDGHTASLFPGDPALAELHRWVVAIDRPALPPKVARLTLTLPALARAERVFFLTSGSEKQSVVARLIEEVRSGTPELPAARVAPRREVVYFLDAAAAGRLPPIPRSGDSADPVRAASEGIA